jgi:hypothetical protein
VQQNDNGVVWIVDWSKAACAWGDCLLIVMRTVCFFSLCTQTKVHPIRASGIQFPVVLLEGFSLIRARNIPDLAALSRIWSKAFFENNLCNYLNIRKPLFTCSDHTFSILITESLTSVGEDSSRCYLFLDIILHTSNGTKERGGL